MGTDLLKALLAPIVAEWGADKVRAAIDNIVASFSDANTQRSEDGVSGAGKKGKAKKLSAVEVVSRIKLAPEVRAVLGVLAARYDAKQFLVTTADIRQFFEDNGVAPPVVKNRSDAVRKVVSVLSGLSQESLESLLESRAYSGPSQLGPLSNAIRQSSAAIRGGSSSESASDESEETGSSSLDSVPGKAADDR